MPPLAIFRLYEWVTGSMDRISAYSNWELSDKFVEGKFVEGKWAVYCWAGPHGSVAKV